MVNDFKGFTNTGQKAKYETTEAETKAHIAMADRLFPLRGNMPLYDRNFITSIRNALAIEKELTPSQKDYLEEMFHEKY